MADLSSDEFLAAKSIFAVVLAGLAIGAILLANAHAQSIWGIAKAVLGIALIVAGLYAGRTAWRRF
jgi:sulfite exporter TauE/SafE